MKIVAFFVILCCEIFAQNQKCTKLQTSTTSTTCLNFGEQDLKYFINPENCNQNILINGYEGKDFGQNRFKICQNMTSLTIEKCRIDKLNNGAFENLNNLEILKIHGNVNYIETKALKNLTNLKTLTISFANVDYVEENSFIELHNLKSIGLFFNKINTVKSGTFKKFQKIEEILLQENNIELLENGLFSDLSKLKIVDLSNNKLTTFLAKNILKNSENIHELYLENNLLENISFETLRNLKILTLDSNKLKTIKQIIFKDNINLKVLTISDNYLTSFSPSAELLINLKHLDLSNNKKLSEIQIRDLTAIQKLSITDNELTKFKSREILKNGGNLKDLDLSHNKIKTVNFDTLYELTTLKLKNNFLTTIDKYTFRNNKKLNILDIENNKLTTFRLPIGGLPHLTVIKLSGNRLKGVQYKFFEMLLKLTYFSLFAENWACSLKEKKWTCSQIENVKQTAKEIGKGYAVKGYCKKNCFK